MPENSNEFAIRPRSSVLSALGQELQLNKDNNTSCGLLVLKVVSMHDVNSFYGYENGDEFISMVYVFIRKILPEKDMVLRISNDELLILLNNISNKNHALLAVNKILQGLTTPFLIGDEKIYAKISVGIAVYPEDSEHEERLLINADTALVKAIEEKKAYIFFMPQQDSGSYPFNVISKELDSAIDKLELSLLYQAKINLQTKSICGAEALMRWNNSRMGSVPADVFIPVSESAGQIMALTLWSMNVAFRQAEQLQSKFPDFQISVNLSPATFYDPNIFQLIKNALNMWSIKPDNVMLEITESAVMHDPENSLKILEKFTDIGLHLSIDDFGTGYSSLAYLKSLPVEELKIDKSFILKMNQNEGDKIIVRSIIELAHNFNLSVTAEGVENRETLIELESLGCDKVQGYYMSRPITGSKFTEFINTAELKNKF